MQEICELGDPRKDIGYLIWQITKIWQRGKHRTLEEFGITSSQMEVLGAVYHLTIEGRKVTQILLSQETSIDPMTTSTILKNLEKKSLIVRKESKTDTRARIVELTEEGRQMFRLAIIKVKEAQAILFRDIDKDALCTQLQILLDEINRLKQVIN